MKGCPSPGATGASAPLPMVTLSCSLQPKMPQRLQGPLDVHKGPWFVPGGSLCWRAILRRLMREWKQGCEEWLLNVPTHRVPSLTSTLRISCFFLGPFSKFPIFRFPLLSTLWCVPPNRPDCSAPCLLTCLQTGSTLESILISISTLVRVSGLSILENHSGCPSEALLF